MTVFEKHKTDIELYEKVSPPPIRGRLLYAMAILSDVYEMLNSPSIKVEVNEVKELLNSVLREMSERG